MKIGRAFAEAAEQVPGMAPLITKMQSRMRVSRSRRRLRRIQQAQAVADQPPAKVEELVGMSASPAEYAAWIVSQEVPRDRQRERTHARHDTNAAAPLVSVLIPVDYTELAVRALHTAFGLDGPEPAAKDDDE